MVVPASEFTELREAAEGMITEAIERIQEKTRKMVETVIGDPPLIPRPGHTLRDEMQELTDLLDAEQQVDLDLMQALKRAHKQLDRVNGFTSEIQYDRERWRTDL